MTVYDREKYGDVKKYIVDMKEKGLPARFQGSKAFDELYRNQLIYPFMSTISLVDNTPKEEAPWYVVVTGGFADKMGPDYSYQGRVRIEDIVSKRDEQGEFLPWEPRILEESLSYK